MYYCKGAPYFARTLKHKRHEISVENLIVSLDVEEKARAKDATRKERATLAPT
jgi:D-ribose pyranose/furanose isomerase RbsD